MPRDFFLSKRMLNNILTPKDQETTNNLKKMSIFKNIYAKLKTTIIQTIIQWKDQKATHPEWNNNETYLSNQTLRDGDRLFACYNI